MLIGIECDKFSKSKLAIYLTETQNFIATTFESALIDACQYIFMYDDNQINYKFNEPDVRWFGCTPKQTIEYVSELIKNNIQNIMPKLRKNIWLYRFELWYQNQLSINPNIRIVVSGIDNEDKKCLIMKLGGIIIPDNLCICDVNKGRLLVYQFLYISLYVTYFINIFLISR